MSTLSTIIITKNEEKNIEEAINSVKFSDQIIVVDAASTDKTVEIAKNLGAETIVSSFDSFSKQREAGINLVKSDFIFYLDADERVSDTLRGEIETILTIDARDVYKIGRQNIYFEKFNWPTISKLERLFRKDSLKGWFGPIHESPVYKGRVGTLSGLILHHTHSDLSSMTGKTISWSEVESQSRIDAKHPKMDTWRFPRVMIPTFFNYYIRQRGYRLGTAGLIESIFQSFSTFITYAKLWEKQNKTKEEN